MAYTRLKSFLIAGFQYHEGALAFSQMEIGTKLQLRAEPENRWDHNAVAIYFADYKLGYIPRDENHDIAKILQAGHEIFETVVQQLDPRENPANQVRVVIFVLPAEQSLDSNLSIIEGVNHE